MIGTDFRAACGPAAGWRTPRIGWRDRSRRSRTRGRSRKPSTPPTARASPGRTWCVADSVRPHRLERLRRRSRAASAWTAASRRRGRDGSRGWNGWLDAAEYPRDRGSARRPTLDGQRPRGGRRHAGQARRRQLRGGLARVDHPRPAAGARPVHGTRSAGHPARRRGRRSSRAGGTCILRTLRRTPWRATRRASAFATSVEDDWSGAASPDSAGYRLTRAFRDQVMRSRRLRSCCRNATRPTRRSTTDRPAAGRGRLEAGQRAAAAPAESTVRVVGRSAAPRRSTRSSRSDRRTARATSQPRTWAESTSRRIAIRCRPRCRSSAGGWTCRTPDMPGDLFTPRMHWGATARRSAWSCRRDAKPTASCRCRPARADIRCRRSTRNSHDAWVRGEPTPFLPGPTEHTLTLVP